LVQKGVEIVSGDFEQPDSVRRAVSGVQGVFSVQPFEPGKARLEVHWGKRLADTAVASGVSHFVYASVFGAGAAPDVPLFTSKAEIETHIRSVGLRHTILQPAGFMENLLMPVVLKGLSKGKLTTPHVVDSLQPLIAVDDIGAIAARVFASPDEYADRTIPLVGDVVSTRTQAEILSRVLGRTIRPGKLPGFLTRVFLGRDLFRMFRWIDTKSHTVPFSVETLRSIYPQLMTFENWCCLAFAKTKG
jgi:uncharacterized protein YbjT (DUF2867 family)